MHFGSLYIFLCIPFPPKKTYFYIFLYSLPKLISSSSSFVFSYAERSLRMSCNGCRVLRKGCNENCMLRQSLQCIDNPQAQAHATVFVAKFFGRASLMSFLYSVPQSQRPVLFQSLLFEAVGRAVNPVSGAVGLLWSGNWNVCQSAVQKVLQGGALEPLPEFSGRVSGSNFEDVSETVGGYGQCFLTREEDFKKRKGFGDGVKCQATDLDLCLMIGDDRAVKRTREATPSEESETTTLGSRSGDGSSSKGDEQKLLRLFI
ncbi:LOB domain-containing protein 38-like [Durio zibethinus]|uniref:LOB domain-containing protein 38-like n=1 Tax=Durio zibethinus TaxID=66656 RepID=A0A6P5YXI0_DURZI|nr:LOB domain-containing protein 38-like [Durio zibethinus]